MSLVREGQLGNTANELIDLMVELKAIQERRNAVLVPHRAAAPFNGAAAGARPAADREFPHLPLKMAAPLSEEDKAAQRLEMDKLGVKFIYHDWPLENIRCGNDFPPHYVYLPTWEHRMLKWTCAICRHSLK